MSKISISSAYVLVMNTSPNICKTFFSDTHRADRGGGGGGHPACVQEGQRRRGGQKGVVSYHSSSSCSHLTPVLQLCFW
jgi:hypothetical protein